MNNTMCYVELKYNKSESTSKLTTLYRNPETLPAFAEVLLFSFSFPPLYLGVGKTVLATHMKYWLRMYMITFLLLTKPPPFPCPSASPFSSGAKGVVPCCVFAMLSSGLGLHMDTLGSDLVSNSS